MERLILKRIDKYIIRKFLGTFFYAISLLIIIIVVFDASEKIDDFINTSASLKEIIFDYYMNFIPYFINLFIYLFIFISVIFFTSKLASNSEIIAIISSGVTFKRLLYPYLVSATLLGLFSFTLTNFIIPYTSRELLDFEKKHLKNLNKNAQRNIHMQIGPGIFIYVENYNRVTRTGNKFSLEEFSGDKLIYRMNADRIVWDTSAKNWRIHSYTVRKIKDMSEVIMTGKVKDTVINLYPDDFVTDIDEGKTMTLGQLNKFIEKQKMKGVKSVKEYEVIWHKRFADPFSAIILTVIGVSLSSRKTRGGLGMHLGAGVGLTFTFIFLMQLSTVFATHGNLSPAIASWIPNLIFGIISLVLLRYAMK